MSLHHGYVPEAWKVAPLVPMLKKLGLEALVENFRPVNNLLFVSKIAEKAVVGQILNHCEENAPLPTNQPAYHPFHSTQNYTNIIQTENPFIQTENNMSLSEVLPQNGPGDFRYASRHNFGTCFIFVDVVSDNVNQRLNYLLMIQKFTGK